MARSSKMIVSKSSREMYNGILWNHSNLTYNSGCQQVFFDFASVWSQKVKKKPFWKLSGSCAEISLSWIYYRGYKCWPNLPVRVKLKLNGRENVKTMCICFLMRLNRVILSHNLARAISSSISPLLERKSQKIEKFLQACFKYQKLSSKSRWDYLIKKEWHL